MDARTSAETVRAAAHRALSGSGVEVEDVVIHPAGKRRLVRVSVVRDIAELPDDDESSPVAPLTLDEVAEATRTISTALDDAEAMGQSAYTLEVSSAGVSTPLTTRPQLRRNVGRLVRAQLTDGSAAAPSGEVTGRLLAVGTDRFRLEGVAEPVPLQELVRAVVQVEFTRSGDDPTPSSQADDVVGEDH